MTRWWWPPSWFRDKPPATTHGRVFFRGFAWSRVNGPSWHGWEGPLDETQRDITSMRSRLPAADSAVLFDREATIQACENAVRALWPVAEPGDWIIADISGHGGDDLGGDPAEPRSEYVCAWDGPWPEWQIQNLARGFRPGVRVLFIIDTCNSRGFAKDRPTSPFAAFAQRMPQPKTVPPEIAALVSGTHAALFRAIRQAKKAGRPRAAGPEPLCGVISAAEEGTPSYDGAFHGIAVPAMRPGVTPQDIVNETRRRLVGRQRPNYDPINDAGEALRNERIPL